MSYLLDVNALIAIGYKHHEFHQRVTHWARGQSLFTCSISEIGFVRVLSALPEAEITVTLCLQLLATMKSEWSLHFLPDTCSAETLPKWVKASKQVTDSHLLDLAKSNSSLLATTDAKIPGAFLIPSND